MSIADKSFYVTTPIYYVNARPHIGHAYTTLVADTVARRHRLLGQPTFFLTGTDEHGQKIERSATAAGIPPQQFADEVSASFRNLWHRMGITYSGSPAAPPLPGLPALQRPEAGFIRTTDPEHIAGVQHLFQQLQANGAIYKGTYTGQYCVSDEAYVDGPPGIHCPDCGRLTETVSESNYYFRLSQFQRPLLDLIESNTLLIQPDSRRNEVLSFLRGNAAPTPTGVIPTEGEAAVERPASPSHQTPGAPFMAQSRRDMSGNVNGPSAPTPPATPLPRTAAGTPYLPGALKDLSISRTSFRWGIPVPGDEDHVIYVWLDALANYMTALGYGQDTKPLFDQFWPADLHLVGKEIIRFHCVYWPAFLLALNPNWATNSEAMNARADTELGAPHLASEMWDPSVTPAPDLPLLSSQAERSAAEGPAFPTHNAPGTPSIAQRNKEGNDTAQPISAPQAEGHGFSRAADTSPAERASALGVGSAKPDSAQLAFDPAWVDRMLPKSVVAHGWLLFEDSKMSKSRGNIVRTETILDAFGQHYLQGIRDHNTREAKKDPTFHPVPEPSPRDQDLFATDVLRYFLLREIPFGQDGSFSFDSLITRYNADLANGYGNLVSRTLSMIEKNQAGLLFELDEDTKDWPEERWLAFAFQKSPGRTQWSDPASAKSAPSFREYSMFQTIEHAVRARELFAGTYGELGFPALLAEAALLIRMTDGFISSEAPWKLAKEPERQGWLHEVLYTAAESIRILTALLYPILPFATAQVWTQLGLGSIEDAAARGDLQNLQWGGLQPGTRLGHLAPLFPRAPKELAQTMADIEAAKTSPAALPANLENVATAGHDASTTNPTEFPTAPLASETKPETSPKGPGAPFMAQPYRDMSGNVNRPDASPSDTTSPAAPPRSTTGPAENPGAQVGGSAATSPGPTRHTPHSTAQPSGVFASAPAATPITATPSDASPQITIDDFAKVELRVARILVCERIPKADKLLRLEVDLGPELGHRQILSGIAEWYTPEDLLGRRIVVITNLAPRKMRGLDSHGMLLAASAADGGKPALATFADTDDLPLGARLK